MSMPASAPRPRSYRLLIIDDNQRIHEDIRKILARTAVQTSCSLENFPPEGSPAPEVSFEIDSAYQGSEGAEKVGEAKAEGRSYALAFVDMRMPPGIDGLETIKRLWEIDEHLQAVICTAYSDYSWEAIAAATGPTAHLIVLRKPFECIEVLQLAHTLTEKWRLELQARLQLAQLEDLIVERTEELAKSHAVFQMIVEDAVQQPRS
jgi:two-component system NtrC family sensor kinase